MGSFRVCIHVVFVCIPIASMPVELFPGASIAATREGNLKDSIQGLRAAAVFGAAACPEGHSLHVCCSLWLSGADRLSGHADLGQRCGLAVLHSNYRCSMPSLVSVVLHMRSRRSSASSVADEQAGASRPRRKLFADSAVSTEDERVDPICFAEDVGSKGL